MECSKDLERRLQLAARTLGRSEADLSRQAILRLLEDFEDGQLAAERLDDPARRWSQEKLEQGVDLAD